MLVRLGYPDGRDGRARRFSVARNPFFVTGRASHLRRQAVDGAWTRGQGTISGSGGCGVRAVSAFESEDTVGTPEVPPPQDLFGPAARRGHKTKEARIRGQCRRCLVPAFREQATRRVAPGRELEDVPLFGPAGRRCPPQG